MSVRVEIASVIYKYFKAKIQMERDLNSIKSELCQNPTFNALSLFASIDRQNKGKISPTDFLSYLKQRGMNATPEEVDGVVLYFSQDSLINLPVFIQKLIPRDMKVTAKCLSTPSECLIQLIFSIIDHNQELKSITELTSQIDSSLFGQGLGILKEFTPQELIRLFCEFDEELDGTSFQIVFGNLKSIPMQTIKEIFVWKKRDRMQSRLYESMIEPKKEFQRKCSMISSQIKIAPEFTSKRSLVMFCKRVDIDPFDRETYLEN